MHKECRAIPELYDYLWKDKTARQVEASQYGKLNVRIPDTVVYSFAKAHAWYFTSSSGKILRRTQLHSQKVIDSMTPAGSSGIAAFSVPSLVDDAPDHLSIQYFDDDSLTDALTRDGLPDHAILQRFVEPKAAVRGQARNTVIQSLWQPHHFLAERWENLHLLNDRRFGRAERAESVEGTRHSTSSAVQSPVVQQRLKELSNSIAEHLFYVADLVTRSMRLYWKIDTHHRIQLLWCSQLDAVSKAQVEQGIPPALTVLPSNPRLFLSHQKHLRCLELRRQKEDEWRNAVLPWDPPCAEEEGGGQRGAGRPGSAAVYRPPSSALLGESDWGEAFPFVRHRLLAKRAVPLFAGGLAGQVQRAKARNSC